MGCPFQNFTLFALFLCPILSPQPCVSVGGTFLSRLSDSRTYCSMNTSSIPDWSWRLLVTSCLGSNFQHSWLMQVFLLQLHLLISAHLMLLLFISQVSKTACKAFYCVCFIHSHNFDAVRSQKAVIHSPVTRFTAAIICISPERFLNKHRLQMGWNDGCECSSFLADLGITSAVELKPYTAK